MTVIPLEKTALTLPEVAELAKAGPIILTRAGKPLAAIKCLSPSEKEALTVAGNPRFKRSPPTPGAHCRRNAGFPWKTCDTNSGPPPSREEKSDARSSKSGLAGA